MFGRFVDWVHDWIDAVVVTIVVLAVVGGVVALIVWAVRHDAQEAAEWERFKAEHHCKVVGRIAGSSSIGIGTSIGAKGSVSPTTVVISEPDRTSWLCDDGVTYTR